MIYINWDFVVNRGEEVRKTKPGDREKSHNNFVLKILNNFTHTCKNKNKL